MVENEIKVGLIVSEGQTSQVLSCSPTAHAVSFLHELSPSHSALCVGLTGSFERTESQAKTLIQRLQFTLHIYTQPTVNLLYTLTGLQEN